MIDRHLVGENNKLIIYNNTPRRPQKTNGSLYGY